MRCIVFFLIQVLLVHSAFGQCSSHPVTLTYQGNSAFPLPKECMSAVHDDLGRPYLYVAGKERGLLIYNVSSLAAPVLEDSVKVLDLDGLELMSVSQSGNYLYLALGNIFVNSSVPGMAIVDVSVPTAPVLKSVWKYHAQSGGAGIVKTEGNYAYLGAMRRGLMILDISDKTHPLLVSVFKPSNSYPNPSNPDSLKYNARGMAVNNSIVYLCDDAGGVRVINATNKSVPIETGRYSNPAIYSRPRAYNNVILDDTLLYVAVDYCGMEVLSIADTSNVRQIGWWNPWHCEAVTNTWFNSPGHTNEIQYDAGCKDVFLSSGKGEIHVVNVSNPSSPDSCTKYSSPGGNTGVWGITLYQDQLYACYIYVPLGIPFFSNWSGLKTFKWNNCLAAQVTSEQSRTSVEVFPNPADGTIHFALPSVGLDEISVSFFDVIGKKIFERQYSAAAEINVSISDFLPGVYYAEIKYNNVAYRKRIVVQR